MTDLETQFAAAAQDAQNLPRRPGNDVLLKLYAFYKQATMGDVAGSRPGMADFAGRAKHDARARLKGQSKEDAMQAYINLVMQLKG